MEFKTQLAIAKTVIMARMFKKRCPLLVSWALTYRCNLKCQYCGYDGQGYKELSTSEAFQMADQLAHLGARYIIFSGGEILLRDDFYRIADYCRSRGMYLSLNSNGILLKDRIHALSSVSEVKISLDGPPGVHDRIRGHAGVYDKVLEALDACLAAGVKTTINTVLSQFNLATYTHVLEIAERFNVGVFFQPATQTLLGSSEFNSIAPPVREYRAVIEDLIKRKKAGNKYILNTIAGLRHVSYWPRPRKIACQVKYLHCYIEPDAKIFMCDRHPSYKKFLISARDDVKSAFANLDLQSCESCWCTSMVDCNLAFNFRPEAVWALTTHVRALSCHED